jgi:hypothetical protein
LRGAEAAGTCDDLEAIGVGTNGDGLDEAVLPDALGKFLKFRLLEGLTGLVVDSWMVSMARNWNALLSCMMPSLGLGWL